MKKLLPPPKSRRPAACFCRPLLATELSVSSRFRELILSRHNDPRFAHKALRGLFCFIDNRKRSRPSSPFQESHKLLGCTRFPAPRGIAPAAGVHFGRLVLVESDHAPPFRAKGIVPALGCNIGLRPQLV